MSDPTDYLPSDEPGPGQSRISFVGFDVDVPADQAELVEQFRQDVVAGLAPHFRGTLSPLDIPRAGDEPPRLHALADADLLVVPWVFEGAHDGQPFRGLVAEDEPRPVRITGVHLIARDSGAVVRIVDDAGLLGQLGVLPSSRRLSAASGPRDRDDEPALE